MSTTSLPDTPAGTQAQWFLDHFGKMLKGREIKARFARSFLDAVSPLKLRAFAIGLKAFGDVTVEEVEGDDVSLEAKLTSTRGPLKLQIVVGREAPHLIEGLIVRPAGPTLEETLRAASPRRDVAAWTAETLGAYAKGLRGERCGLVAAVSFEGEDATFTFGSISADAIFEIGSITKALTASLLAEMMQSGEVALSDPIERYLPEGVSLSPSSGAAPITLLELATHTSGLPRLPTNLHVADPTDPYKTLTIDALFEGFSATPLDGRGAVAYSNLGYAVLGNVLARAAGLDYGALLAERVLARLGMASATVGPDPTSDARRVHGHRDGAIVPYWTGAAIAPAGGVEATVGDVLAFARAHAGAGDGSALSATHVRYAERGNDTYMGLAWIIVGTELGDVLWHNGGTGGFRSFVAFHKKSGTAVAVLTNSSDGEGPDVATGALIGSLVRGAQSG